MQRVNIQAIDKRANVTLAAWNVFEVQLPHDAAPTWHLCGFRRETSRGKVSSALYALDPKNWRCITRSGNIYELQGPPGCNSDALATRGQWLQMNQIQQETDVTFEFFELLHPAGQP